MVILFIENGLFIVVVGLGVNIDYVWYCICVYQIEDWSKVMRLKIVCNLIVISIYDDLDFNGKILQLMIFFCLKDNCVFCYLIIRIVVYGVVFIVFERLCINWY